MRARAINASVYDGERLRSQKALRDIADRVERNVAALGGSLGPIGLASTNPADFLASVAGVHASGNIAVPLSTRAPASESHERDVLVRRLAHVGCAGALVDEEHAPVFADAGFRRGSAIDGSSLSMWSAERLAPSPLPGPASLIVFTSGSTGTPKGAVISHEAFAAIQRHNNDLHSWNRGDIFLAALPFSHLAGLSTTLAALGSGVPVVCAPRGLPSTLPSMIARHEVTVTGLVPFQLAQILAASADSQLDTLRLVVTSGAPITSAVIEQARRALPGTKLVNAYGLTEAFRSFAVPVVDAAQDPAFLGRPRPGVEATVRRGELLLRGENLFDGYWKEPRKALTDDGWLPTGDVADVDENGNIRLVGRRSNIVNVAGEKTPVEVVEAILDRAAPGRIAATATPGADGNDHVIAVAERTAGVSLQELKRMVSRKLGPSLRPRQLVEVGTLPRTAETGKFDRKQLAQLAQGHAGPAKEE